MSNVYPENTSEQREEVETSLWKTRLLLAGNVLLQTVKDLVTDHMPQWAAAISYFGLLSIFPLLLAGVSLAAYFVEPQWALQQVTNVMGKAMPRGEGLVEDIIKGAIEERGSTSLISIAAWLWTGSRVFGVLTMALNIAYDVDEAYSYWKRLAVELLMTLSVGVLFLLALSSGFVLGLLWDVVQFLPAQGGATFELLKVLVPTLLLAGVFFLIYWLVPHGKRHWKSALPAAVVATLLFLLAQPLFYQYIERFSNHNLIYGSLGIVIILMIWAWLLALITLFGGELASHIQFMVFEGKSAEEVGELHKSRSPTQKKNRAPEDINKIPSD